MKKQFSILAILAVILLAALAASPVLGGGEQGLEKAKQAQERHTDALLAKDGVVGTALGLDENGNAVIQVFTARQGVGGIPAKLDGVAVQVKVTGAFEARDDERLAYPSPVPIGVSSSNENSIVTPYCFTGTLGARLVGVVDGIELGYGLSNNHVYANLNGANGAGPGTDVIQPGLADSGCTTNNTTPIGTLTAYVPIDFDGGDNFVDAAIAIDGDQANPLIGTATPDDERYGEPSTQALVCDNDACGNLLNILVQKRGRTTHLTQGEITGVNAIIKVNYGRGKKARFVDQLVIQNPDTAFSAGGDSGSLVVTANESANPVGLLFAGSSTSTIVNRIDLVFSQLASNVCDGCTAVVGLSVDGKAPVADTTAPSFSSGSVAADGTTVTVTFDEELLAASPPPGSAFVVTSSSGEVSGTAAAVSISGPVVTFTLSSALEEGETATLAYTQPASDPRIQDAALNLTASFSGEAVANNTVAPDTTAPSFSSGSIAADGTTVRVTFDEELAASAAPPGSAFEVTGTVSGSVFGTTDAVLISGTVVIFTLSSALEEGETATLAYTPPASDPRIQDAAGNLTASFSGEAVANNTVAAGSTMHVGDLDGVSTKLQRGAWSAEVTITVHDAAEAAVSGATVTGTFTQNGDTIGPRSCTTGDAGTCTIDSGKFPNNSGNATFTVDSVTHTLNYDLGANHDPDGDSDGTTIDLSK